MFLKSACAFLLSTGVSTAWAADARFVAKELFRIPFGSDRRELGTRVEGDRLVIPDGFTRDEQGRFYIYDRAKHRIVRFSSGGVCEIAYRYPATARQVFVHADRDANLLMLVADPIRGLYNGVYDAHGKLLRSAQFSQFNRYRLHVGDEGELRMILSSDQDPRRVQVYIFDPATFLMKKEAVALPPEGSHQIRKQDQVFYVDRVPGSGSEGEAPVSRIRQATSRRTADIRGEVLTITGAGEIYTRVGAREIRVYDVDGSLKGRTRLSGRSFSIANLRLDTAGNLYQLDGIPDRSEEDVLGDPTPNTRDLEDRRYTAHMPGMRIILWERQ